VIYAVLAVLVALGGILSFARASQSKKPRGEKARVAVTETTAAAPKEKKPVRSDPEA